MEEGRYFLEGIDRVVTNVSDVEDPRAWDEENDGGGARMGQTWRASTTLGVLEQCQNSSLDVIIFYICDGKGGNWRQSIMKQRLMQRHRHQDRLEQSEGT